MTQRAVAVVAGHAVEDVGLEAERACRHVLRSDRAREGDLFDAFGLLADFFARYSSPGLDFPPKWKVQGG